MIELPNEKFDDYEKKKTKENDQITENLQNSKINMEK